LKEVKVTHFLQNRQSVHQTRGVDTGLESCLKIHKELEIFDNSLEIRELFWNLWQFLNNSKIHGKLSKIYHNSQFSLRTILENLWTILENLWTIRRQFGTSWRTFDFDHHQLFFQKLFILHFSCINFMFFIQNWPAFQISLALV
jgi:hypothetical protein